MIKKFKIFETKDDLDPYGEEIWNEKKLYKIYTSWDGEIEFGMHDLELVNNNNYFFTDGFKEQYRSLQNHLETRVDLNRMFIFIETDYGDFAEYKIFNI